MSDEVRLMTEELPELPCCRVHENLLRAGKLEPFDNCIACIRNERNELREEVKAHIKAIAYQCHLRETAVAERDHRIAELEAERDRLARELAEAQQAVASANNVAQIRYEQIVKNNADASGIISGLARELAEARKDTARRCAEICEDSEVLLPLSAWQTRRSVSAATAVELGAMIRREFALDAARTGGRDA